MAVEFVFLLINSTAIITCPVSSYHTYKMNTENRIKTLRRNKLIIITKGKLSYPKHFPIFNYNLFDR